MSIVHPNNGVQGMFRSNLSRSGNGENIMVNMKMRRRHVRLQDIQSSGRFYQARLCPMGFWSANSVGSKADRQTDRDRQTDLQTDSQPDSQIARQPDSQPQSSRQADIHTWPTGMYALASSTCMCLMHIFYVRSIAVGACTLCAQVRFR